MTNPTNRSPRDASATAPKVWLVCNKASGSNDEDALAELAAAFAAAGYPLDRKICFPDEPAPKPSQLDAEGVDILAVFAGDGTTHAVVTGTYGWGGAVLVLPGGTMNLLAKRLHGEHSALEIVARLARSVPRRVRPNVVRTRHGDGLSGALAGPGAVWNDVREAMRANDVGEFVSTAAAAITRSSNAPGVVGRGIDCTREGGYAAITVTPTDAGLETKGYYAETIGDYAGQGLALLGRNFRNGPHDDIGVFDELTIETVEEGTIDLLIDGEPFSGGTEELYQNAACEVDLLATRDAR